MKITAIHTHHVCIPYDMGAPRQEFAGLKFATMDHLLIQVDTDAGITGWGEGFGHTIIPATKAALECYVAPWFIGKDPTDIAKLHREAAQHFHLFGGNGPIVYAHSGVDIALWDIAGKRAGLPLSQLLGGARRTEVRAMPACCATAHRRRSHEYARSGRRPGSNISSCTSIPSLR